MALWFGQRDRAIETAKGAAVRYHGDLPPLPIRWIVVRDPTGRLKPQAFLATNPNVTPEAMLGLCSLVAPRMDDLVKAKRIAPQATAWYRKTNLTFSVVIAAVRRKVWPHQTFGMSRSHREITETRAHVWSRMEVALAHAG